MPNPNLTGEAVRSHLYYRPLDIVNGFLSQAKFDNAAAPAAGAAAAGAGAAAPAAAVDDKAKAGAGAPAAGDKGTEAKPGEEAAGSIMDDASKEEKAAEDKENKRLLETPEKDLNDADKAKRTALIEKNKAADAAKGVPEKYDFKAPEGFTLNQGLIDKFTPLAKELGLSQEKAQKLVDFQAEIQKTSIAAQAETFKTFVEGLKAETIKELGANYKQELSFAAKARDRFASPELIEKLNESGLANDKDMVKLFITIGKAVSEDKPPEGGSGAAGGPKKPEEILFPSANKS